MLTTLMQNLKIQSIQRNQEIGQDKTRQLPKELTHSHSKNKKQKNGKGREEVATERDLDKLEK